MTIVFCSIGHLRNLCWNLLRIRADVYAAFFAAASYACKINTAMMTHFISLCKSIKSGFCLEGCTFFLTKLTTFFYSSLSKDCAFFSSESWRLEMGRRSDFNIRPKPKVWAGSPNECRTFGRTSAECCVLGWNNVFYCRVHWTARKCRSK